MSRIGEAPIKIEEGVTVEVNGKVVAVKAGNNELTTDIPEGIKVEVKDGEVLVTRENDEKHTKSLHGTIRMLIANDIVGVKEGYKKTLKLVGVGYRVNQQGTKISMNLGWNHPVEFEAPEGITFEVPDETTIHISGADKQLVGQTAAKIRAVRKPEPYKGKGIRYEDEYVRRKSRKIATAA